MSCRKIIHETRIACIKFVSKYSVLVGETWIWSVILLLDRKGVKLGEWDTNSPIDYEEDLIADPPVDIDIAEIIVHNGYRNDSVHRQDDIALIRLVRPVNFTYFIKPICLPIVSSQRNMDYSNETTFVVAGWGVVNIFFFYIFKIVSRTNDTICFTLTFCFLFLFQTEVRFFHPNSFFPTLNEIEFQIKPFQFCFSLVNSRCLYFRFKRVYRHYIVHKKMLQLLLHSPKCSFINN